MRENYYWLDDVCYASFDFPLILAFNVNVQKCSAIYMNNIGSPFDWFVDNNVLVVQANDYYHRFNLK